MSENEAAVSENEAAVCRYHGIYAAKLKSCPKCVFEAMEKEQREEYLDHLRRCAAAPIGDSSAD